jgi:hypothetical protein
MRLWVVHNDVAYNNDDELPFLGSYPGPCSTVHCHSERPALPRHFEYHHGTNLIFGCGAQKTYGTA